MSDRSWRDRKYYPEDDPWHYILFSQLRLYRWLVGGTWEHVVLGGKPVLWVRIKT